MKLAIILQTCDKYSDVWEAFYTLFFKYWPDCPYQIYHVTEYKQANYKNVNTINTGNMEWSARLKFALDQIPQPYVLLLLEDYLLIEKVHTERFDNFLEIMENENASYLRIFPVPGPDKPYKNYPELGQVSFNAPYSISTQAAIWKRESLLYFLKPDESVWQLEIDGSLRSHELQKPILSVKIQETGTYAYTYLCTAVYKGRWMREAGKLSEKEGIKLDYDYRPLETREQFLYRKYYLKTPLPLKHLWDFLRSRFFN